MIMFVCMHCEMLCDMSHLHGPCRVAFLLVVVVWKVLYEWSSGKPPWAACRIKKKKRVSSKCLNMIVFVCLQFEMLCDMGPLVVNFRVGFVIVVFVWNVMHS